MQHVEYKKPLVIHRFRLQSDRITPFRGDSGVIGLHQNHPVSLINQSILECYIVRYVIYKTMRRIRAGKKRKTVEEIPGDVQFVVVILFCTVKCICQYVAVS